jgi:hypothetical protein
VRALPIDPGLHRFQATLEPGGGGRFASIDPRKCLQVEIVGDDRLGGLDDRASLDGAEPVALEVGRLQRCEVIRVVEGARAARTVGGRLAAVGGEKWLSSWIPTASDSC